MYRNNIRDMDDLFRKIERKPEPKQKIDVVINVAQEKSSVKLTTKIIDETGKSKFDRSDFESRFNQHKEVMKTSDYQPKKSEKVLDTSTSRTKSKKPKLLITSSPKLETEQEVEPPKIDVKRKLGKIKLKTNLQGTVTGFSKLNDPIKRKTSRPQFETIQLQEPMQVQVGTLIKKENMPEKQAEIKLPVSTFYMNNRAMFINFINQLFLPYKNQLEEESKNITCESRGGDSFTLLTHQKIIRDYINLLTPYRGLLLYHGLGAGKTCASIAIAEGFKETKQILVLTPASLRMNYIEEIKNCGDILYKKNQYWEFIETDNIEYINQLSQVLNVAPRYIQKQGGAWVSNKTKTSNFNLLSQEQKDNLDRQLNEMIANKYQFINYNGLQERHLGMITNDFTINPFSNRVVIIDEAHNFISRIVNKLKKKSGSLAIRLYQYLMEAIDCRIILLSGTPMINYPNEIAVLFNILRGKIKTWTVKLDVQSKKKIDNSKIRELLKDLKTLDYMDYNPSSGLMTFTRNPNYFVNKYATTSTGKKYAGVQKKSNISDSENTEEAFFQTLTRTLKKNGINISDSVSLNEYDALPDNLDLFLSYFINEKDMTFKNKLMFQKRIVGLTSYFRSAQEQLMPKYDPDRGDYQILYINMSDYQFGIYESARVQERKLEQQNSKRRKKSAAGGDLYDDAVSTYRIFSRAFCNFVFPREIGRPMPTKVTDDDIGELSKTGDTRDETIQASINQTLKQDLPQTALDTFSQDIEPVAASIEAQFEDIGIGSIEDQLETGYEQRIQAALTELETRRGEFLTKKALELYSPKFLNVLENVLDPKYIGSHLIYTQFRTLEGIGILKLIFENNGMMHFKIAKTPEGQWVIDVPDEILAQRLPGFILYTGTETSEEKEILRNIFNSNWDYVPPSIVSELKKLDQNNFYGQIIKIIMITASGAEGITLKNVRFVHLIEPYWHPVRTEQVIGRARRICSHEDLEEQYRTVQVMLYLMKFSDEQLASDDSIELRLHDKSKFDNVTPVTSDQTLYEISKKKQEISSQLLNAVKETAIDCNIHDLNKNEGLSCLSFGTPSSKTFTYKPNITGEEADTIAQLNQYKIKWNAKELIQNGKKYALREETDEIYTYDSYINAVNNPGFKPELLGKLIRDDKGVIVGIEPTK